MRCYVEVGVIWIHTKKVSRRQWRRANGSQLGQLYASADVCVCVCVRAGVRISESRRIIERREDFFRGETLSQAYSRARVRRAI